MTTASNTAVVRMENRILEVACEVFMEKGFEGASMSDIAAQIGITRPALHYYYHTKDKLFQAVFLSIIEKIIPKIQNTLDDDKQPFEDRISAVVDTYMEVVKNNPQLPMFVMGEINRNAKDFFEAVRSVYVDTFLQQIGNTLTKAMDKGEIKRVPLRIIFNTFYGLLIFPFLSRGLVDISSGKSPEQIDSDFCQMIEEWKPYMKDQIVHLLSN